MRVYIYVPNLNAYRGTRNFDYCVTVAEQAETLICESGLDVEVYVLKGKNSDYGINSIKEEKDEITRINESYVNFVIDITIGETYTQQTNYLSKIKKPLFSKRIKCEDESVLFRDLLDRNIAKEIANLVKLVSQTSVVGV